MFSCEFYPNHDTVGRPPDTLTGRTQLQDFEYMRLIQEGFTYITHSAMDGLKRKDSMGRTVVISPCPRIQGKWRVWHSYLGHKIESKFDMSVEYAKDVLAGRDNHWLFLKFPEEVALP